MEAPPEGGDDWVLGHNWRGFSNRMLKKAAMLSGSQAPQRSRKTSLSCSTYPRLGFMSARPGGTAF